MFHLQDGAAGASFVMPSAEAWAQFEVDAQKQKVNLTESKLNALFSYLLTRAPISSQTLSTGAAVPMALTADKKAAVGLCPKGTNATIMFKTDTTSDLPASSDAASAAPAPAAAAPTALPGALPAATLPAAATASPAFQPATGAAGAAAYPGSSGSTLGSSGGFQTAPAATAPVPSAITAPGLGRKLQAADAADLAGGATGGDLLLPTTFVDQGSSQTGGAAAAAVAGKLQNICSYLCYACLQRGLYSTNCTAAACVAA